MNRDKTRLFIAVPGGPARGVEDREQSSAAEERALPASRDEEQTRFLPVELLLEQQRRESAQLAGLHETATDACAPEHARSGSSSAQPVPSQLDDTDFRWAFANATLAGRARRAWRSLSIVSRISVGLALLFALLVLLPRVLPAALESTGPLTRAALVRAEPRPAAAPAASGTAGTAAPSARAPVATASADLPANGAGVLPAAPAVSPRA
ncbi:MAG TPA: hypothetical protein VK509_03410, partial [Polyangiales bacterium]|nr:hypothetical protein [Polyangiales bacterium]